MIKSSFYNPAPARDTMRYNGVQSRAGRPVGYARSAFGYPQNVLRRFSAATPHRTVRAVFPHTALRVGLVSSVAHPLAHRPLATSLREATCGRVIASGCLRQCTLRSEASAVHDATSPSSNRTCGFPAYGFPLSAFPVAMDFFPSVVALAGGLVLRV